MKTRAELNSVPALTEREKYLMGEISRHERIGMELRAKLDRTTRVLQSCAPYFSWDCQLHKDIVDAIAKAEGNA